MSNKWKDLKIPLNSSSLSLRVAFYFPTFFTWHVTGFLWRKEITRTTCQLDTCRFPLAPVELSSLMCGRNWNGVGSMVWKEEQRPLGSNFRENLGKKEQIPVGKCVLLTDSYLTHLPITMFSPLAELCLDGQIMRTNLLLINGGIPTNTSKYGAVVGYPH